MTTLKIQQMAKLAKRLAEILTTAAICVEEIRIEIDAEFDIIILASYPIRIQLHYRRRPPHQSTTHSRPIYTLRHMECEIAASRTHSGFWVLARLSRCPNQYVTHLDLLHDVWDDESLTTATIRSVVRHLRRRLRDGGMDELAAAIRGHNGHTFYPCDGIGQLHADCTEIPHWFAQAYRILRVSVWLHVPLHLHL